MFKNFKHRSYNHIYTKIKIEKNFKQNINNKIMDFMNKEIYIIIIVYIHLGI